MILVIFIVPGSIGIERNLTIIPRVGEAILLNNSFYFVNKVTHFVDENYISIAAS